MRQRESGHASGPQNGLSGGELDVSISDCRLFDLASTGFVGGSEWDGTSRGEDRVLGREHAEAESWYSLGEESNSRSGGELSHKPRPAASPLFTLGCP